MIDGNWEFTGKQISDDLWVGATAEITDQGLVLPPEYSEGLIAAQDRVSPETDNYTLIAAIDGDGEISVNMVVGDLEAPDEEPFANVSYSHADEILKYEVSYFGSLTSVLVPYLATHSRIFIALTVNHDAGTVYLYENDAGGFFQDWTSNGDLNYPFARIVEPVVRLQEGAGVYGSHWSDTLLSESEIRAIITAWGYTGGAADSPFPVLLNLPQAVLALSPAGYWRLDETSGTTAIDYSGNDRHGVYSGGVSLAAEPGNDGVAYARFDGVDDMVTVADHNDWSVTAAGLTVLVMYRTDSVASIPNLIGKKLTATTGAEWRIYGSLTAVIERPTGELAYRSVATIGPAQVWQLGIVRWTNPTTPPRIWWNMTEPSKTTAAPGGTPGPGTAPLTFAAVATEMAYAGALAHIAIWPTAISDADIVTLQEAAYQDVWLMPPPIVTDRGGSDTGSGVASTSLSFPATLAYAVGEMHVVMLAHDNAAAGGTAPATSVTDSKGNTYTMERREVINPSATPNVGQVCEIWTSIIETPLVVSDTITIDYGMSVVSKLARCKRVQPWRSGVTLHLVESAGATVASATSITLTTLTVGVSNALLCAAAGEDRNGSNGDSDTTGGSWSSYDNRTSGAPAPDQNGSNLGVQHKIVNFPTIQTWTATRTSARHWAAAAIVVGQL